MNALFQDCDLASEFDKRNEIISDWDEEYDQLVEELEEEFCRKQSILEKALVESIMENQLARPTE
jgi:hypothetical protein